MELQIRFAAVLLVDEIELFFINFYNQKDYQICTWTLIHLDLKIQSELNNFEAFLRSKARAFMGHW